MLLVFLWECWTRRRLKELGRSCAVPCRAGCQQCYPKDWLRVAAFGCLGVCDILGKAACRSVRSQISPCDLTEDPSPLPVSQLPLPFALLLQKSRATIQSSILESTLNIPSCSESWWIGKVPSPSVQLPTKASCTCGPWADFLRWDVHVGRGREVGAGKNGFPTSTAYA